MTGTSEALFGAALAADPQPAHGQDPLLELTTQMSGGSDEAWNLFHQEFGPGLFRTLMGWTAGDTDLANEALQQAYLRIAKHVRPCSSEPMFIAWIRIVARSALSDCRRRRSGFTGLLRRFSEGLAPHDETEADSLPLASVLEDALKQIGAESRAILEAKYFRGKSVRAIALELAISAKAAESRLTRARTELRHHIEEALKRHEP